MVTIDVSKAIKGLENLERKVAKKYTRQALRAGAKVTLKVATSTAPDQTGTIKKSIKIRAGRGKRGFIHVVVGLAKKWFASPVFYAAFDLFGHKVGRMELGAERKQVAPNEFMTNAYETTKDDAIRVFETTIRTLIEENK